MATSKTSIANYALAILGSKRVSDIADTTSKNARILTLHYDQARKECLRLHRWNWALHRATLSRHADSPAYGFSYQYPLPSDFIRLDQVNELSVWNDQRADWFQIEHGLDSNENAIGKVLLTDADSVRIRYVADIEDVSLFDPLFVQALSVLLASKAARAITGSDSREAQLRRQFEEFDLPTAQQVDGAETSGNENPPLIDAMNRSYFAQSRGFIGTSLAESLPPSSTVNYPSPTNDEVDISGDW